MFQKSYRLMLMNDVYFGIKEDLFTSLSPAFSDVHILDFSLLGISGTWLSSSYIRLWPLGWSHRSNIPQSSAQAIHQYLNIRPCLTLELSRVAMENTINSGALPSKNPTTPPVRLIIFRDGGNPTPHQIQPVWMRWGKGVSRTHFVL